ncbi:hypothetical protein DMA11_22550 [Marinilabiliaceae bacterium JC017]|nr:hypothetical protein DMA11_22550 [Marinilabiliaceae bacterium JC017]
MLSWYHYFDELLIIFRQIISPLRRSYATNSCRHYIYPHLTSNIPRFQHLTSNIPTSHVPHPHVPHRTSPRPNIPHRTS